jgi:3-vinyl bacteriochlorophyllide hydratase
MGTPNMEPGTVSGKEASAGLYTPEQRARRDATKWTLVQGILAPVQFLVCILSAALVIRFLLTGEGLWAANVSVLVKTVILLTIMVTGSIWEKVVLMGVIALHLLYVGALFGGWMSAEGLMTVALIAYAAYIINAVQFVLKLRAARLQEAASRFQGAMA